MCAKLALRHADGVHKILQTGELQRRQSQALGNLCHHPLILRRIGLCILFEVLRIVALKVLDDAACDQFHITLRRGEADKRTAIHQRRTGDTAMHLLGAILEERPHVILQLGATDDGVIAEDHSLIL